MEGVRESGARAHDQAVTLLAIALGGALGAPTRYGIALLVPVTPGSFPWATFWTNVSGALVLGLFLSFVIERRPPARLLRPFFAVGFLGAYTTFSTFAVETATLVKDGDVVLGVGYTIASMGAGVMVAAFGMWVGRALGAER